MLRLEIKGSLKGLNSFFDSILIELLNVDDTIEINGVVWIATYVELFGNDTIHLRLVTENDKP